MRRKGNHGGSGRSREQNEALERYFEGLPVVEASTVLRLIVTKGDWDGSVPKDPYNCVLSRAAGRQCGSTVVLFFRRVAYVDLPQDDGSRAVERYYLNAQHGRRAAALIKAFDKAARTGRPGPWPFENGEVSILLTAPSASKTLESMRRQNTTRRRAKLRGVLKSVTRVRAGKKGLKNRYRVGALGVRDGTGMVQFHRAS